MASLISAVVWVPKGVAARHPQKYNIADPAEYARIEKLGKLKLLDAQRELEEFEKLQKGVDGMQVDSDAGDGDGDGDDEAAWEDDDDEEDGKNEKKDSDAEDEDEDDGDNEDEVQLKSDAEPEDDGQDDEMKKYNLDNYDEEVSQSAGEC